MTKKDLSTMYGSYRHLLATETVTTCSGRDDMCRSVLKELEAEPPTEYE